VQFYAFDILVSDGEDLRKLPLSMRKANLALLLARRIDGIHLADFEQGEIGPDLFRHALPDGSRRAGLEASRQPLSRRPVPALDQGQEPAASSLQSGAGSIRLSDGVLRLALVYLDLLAACLGALVRRYTRSFNGSFTTRSQNKSAAGAMQIWR